MTHGPVCRAQIIRRLRRANQVDREAPARLVRSISRFLDPPTRSRRCRLGGWCFS